MIQDITMPDIKLLKQEGNLAEFEIAPLYPGYGMTVGNALRRILLSSIVGTAVSGVKIEGASHEFTTIKGVVEDVVNIVLNIRSINFISHQDDKVVVKLKKKGKSVVKASDIVLNQNVEIANPDQVIAHIDDSNAVLDIEIYLEQGRGFYPVENRVNQDKPVGVIAVDSLFSPIKKVNFTLENTRVGQMTNLDRLVLTLETNGTISPLKAVEQASAILVAHFQALAGVETLTVIDIEDEHSMISNLKNVSIDDLGMTPRTTNALNNNGLSTVLQLSNLTREELKNLKGFGQKAYEEVITKLKEMSLEIQ
jgi:DNA-directed RNA polymerase subunit alpha